MHLIIGLGNFGKKYSLNIHNVGQLALDEIISKYGLDKTTSKFKASIYKGSMNNIAVIAMKPKTFMNECGSACAEVSGFYKVQPENVIVLQDDLSMELGKIRVKVSGGDGGHNGIKSINAFMQNNYVKVKIGIGYPVLGKDAVNQYVLSDFTDDERARLKPILQHLASSFTDVIARDYHKFSSVVNNLIQR
jgi:PTH1 family peptidyl-tRNA hydrolase